MSRFPVFGVVFDYVFPPILIAIFMARGLPSTLWYMLTHPWHLPFPSIWRDNILNGGQPFLLAAADKAFGKYKKEVLSHAYGRVLEVGAGTGETVKYYDSDKVDVVYGVEPN